MEIPPVPPHMPFNAYTSCGTNWIAPTDFSKSQAVHLYWNSDNARRSIWLSQVCWPNDFDPFLSFTTRSHHRKMYNFHIVCRTMHELRPTVKWPSEFHACRKNRHIACANMINWSGAKKEKRKRKKKYAEIKTVRRVRKPINGQRQMRKEKEIVMRKQSSSNIEQRHLPHRVAELPPCVYSYLLDVIEQRIEIRFSSHSTSFVWRIFFSPCHFWRPYFHIHRCGVCRTRNGKKKIIIIFCL